MLPDSRRDEAADRLDSWKDIAGYLRRDVSTVQRWEKREGLPVHRHQHDKLGSVYAFKSELDAWWQRGRKRLEVEPAATRDDALRPTLRRRLSQSIAVISAFLLLTAVVGAAIWLFAQRSDPGSSGVVARSVIPLPPGASSAYSLAVSPDGSHLAYVGWTGPLASPRLYLKAMNALASSPVAGTEGAAYPFFSPDGRWIGFFANRQLKKVAVTGGAPVTLAEARQPRGATWGAADTIVYAPQPLGGLWRISAGGGTPVQVTTPDRSRFERSHREPHLLPGGRAALFVVHRATHASFDDADIEAVILETGERRVVVQGGMAPVYTSSGHLAFGRHGVLLAAPFDLNRLATTAPPTAVIDGVRTQSYTGRVAYGVSGTGTLVYAPGHSFEANRNLVWVDRSGKETVTSLPAKPFMYPRIAPDGRHAVIEVDNGSPKLWVYDLAREILTRRPLEWDTEEPVWTRDGRGLTFGWNPFAPDGTSRSNVYVQPLDGSSPPRALTRAPLPSYWVYDWTPDGRQFLFGQVTSMQQDLWLVAIDGDGVPRPLATTPYNERAARFAPNGRWLAYVSDESGREEVYIQSFPGPGEKKQVSIDGGHEPVWARDGSEIYYRADGNRMMVAEIGAHEALAVSRPRTLFTGAYFGFSGLPPQYDVTADGRFLMIKTPEGAKDPTELVLVQNWFAELNRTTPRRD